MILVRNFWGYVSKLLLVPNHMRSKGSSRNTITQIFFNFSYEENMAMVSSPAQVATMGHRFSPSFVKMNLKMNLTFTVSYRGEPEIRRAPVRKEKKILQTYFLSTVLQQDPTWEVHYNVKSFVTLNKSRTLFRYLASVFHFCWLPNVDCP